MDTIEVLPPNRVPWTIAVRQLADGGVSLVIGYEMAGEQHELPLDMDRPASRRLACAILAAGGDATERSFTGGSGR